MNKLVAGIIGVIIVAAIVIGAVLFFIVRDDEEDDGAAAIRSARASAAPVVRADAVVIPIQSADLGMPRQGVVSNVLVRENDAVEEGQLLVRLDDTDAAIAVQRAEAALASAQADINTLKLAIEKERELYDEARPGNLEQARSAAQAAQERFLHLSGANRSPGASVSADGALLEAEYAEAIADAERLVRQSEEKLLLLLGVASTSDIAETPASVASKVARDKQIDDIRFAIFDLEIALEDAENMDKLNGDAEDAVAVANALLQNSMRLLDVAELKADEADRKAEDAYEDALFEWRQVHKTYMGIELTDDELLQDPDTLFRTWGVDLDTLFDRKNQSFPNQVLEDNPATRWNELKLFGWLSLHPTPSSVYATCEGVNLPRGFHCVERDYDDAWNALATAQEAMDSTQLKGANAVAGAENAVVQARQRLENAERALEILQGGKQEMDAASIRSDIDAANAKLEDLMASPDATEVAQAEANIVTAEAALAAIWPDDREIALAKQQLEDAELQIAKLEAGRDPLDEERREARIAAAEARIAVLQVNLDAARIALEDSELRAPFAGVVVALKVDAGEEVNARQVVMSLANVSEWELLTVDLDELSVVNLSEGDNVKVSFDALPELEMSGTVSRISRFGEEVKGSVTYAAEIRLSGTDSRLRWGMTASVRK